MNDDRQPDPIAEAITFAAQAHAGQPDKAGLPYIYHPLRVMLSVKESGGTETEIIAAVLHDVVEDTDTTLDELAELFSTEIADLVDSLSRREGEEYVPFIERCVQGGPSAIKIKQADLTDNSNPERLARLPVDQRNELQAKYQSGLDVIERALRRAQASS